jgi:hypothetical protein
LYKEIPRIDLGVAESDRSAQKISMETLVQPGCAKLEARSLHRQVKQPFTDGSLYTPDHLLPKVYVLHIALYKTTLPIGGQQRVLNEFAIVVASFTLDRRAVRVRRLLFSEKK